MRTNTVALVSFILLFFSLTSCSVFCKAKINQTMEIEFYSKGSGIDFKAKKLLEEFIISYNETNQVKIYFTTTKHGKEGETTFFLDLTCLSNNERDLFKNNLNEQLKNANNYRIKEIEIPGN